MSTGLFVWDKDGHEVQFIDYNSSSPTNDPRGTILRDNILYLSGRMNGGGTFGNYTLPAGEDRAYVLKYVDTFFSTPYVYVELDDSTNHGGGGEVRITVVGDEGAFVAYPNPFRQSVKIRVESGALKVENGVATAWLTDLSGRREQVRLTPDGPGQYSLDLTSRPQATYLLTLTTADGKQHTVRLLKQSDIFAR
ncbi:MAG: T9SS type A sorting domain-containing protein [Bacteroidales bacterium]|nr:T9SS type A sorting domain-containing protein [Bacteroidales bacterium]